MNRRSFMLSAVLGASALPLAATPAFATGAPRLRGTGDLGIVIERATGSVLIIDTTKHERIARVEGFGDISHASAVFSRDERFAYVFGRDGGLTKLDILTAEVVARTVQSGNAIGGAISDDGKLVAVSNYEPGGVKVFDAETLELFADIKTGSKTIGLVDVPGRRFVFSTWEAGEAWIADFSKGPAPAITKIEEIGANPYDALVTGDGRHYIAGLFGEDGLAHIDLWEHPLRARKILAGYGRGEKPLPVYKMPHLEGWAKASGAFYLPAIGRHEVLIVDDRSFEEVGRVPLLGQPVFAMSRPDGRQVFVNFAPPDNRFVQVIDTPSRKVAATLEPGPGVLHMEFAPRGHEVWMSVRDENELQVWDTAKLEKIASLPAEKPSGIFFTARAHKTGL
ncbi:protein nirF [Rhizobiales bacterium]|uniref:cytochrome D1 domain-containing protein n=1 Tax=Hongsoonwoonella zoysiae TaxID=2821844 RepID=UPI0015613A85|nr:cytochrome D1 domain-containing protein [Hongsoonwoonella zoysiae]NRG18215.1 protein nirF [Hongsoonwoonella zoysiae]